MAHLNLTVTHDMILVRLSDLCSENTRLSSQVPEAYILLLWTNWLYELDTYRVLLATVLKQKSVIQS